jgi:hypothetical protein
VTRSAPWTRRGVRRALFPHSKRHSNNNFAEAIGRRCKRCERERFCAVRTRGVSLGLRFSEPPIIEALP